MNKLNRQQRGLGHLSWRSYNSIKKKAMEQEFSWSGLSVCLSIAFFISISSAQVLNLTYQSIVNKQSNIESAKKVYQIETVESHQTTNKALV